MDCRIGSTALLTAVSLAALAVAGSGCKDRERKEAGNRAATTDACAGATHQAGAISWFRDRYAEALACAAASKRPLVIDAWAPWCHTCLSMQHHVLTDKSFAPLADRFVWLAIDTDRSANAAAVARYPQKFWPTFFIVSSDETLHARHQGAASIKQFRAFLEQGEAGHLAHVGGKTGDPLLVAIRRADQAALAQDWASAARSYAAARKLAPAGSSRLPGILVGHIGALYQQGEFAACLRLARAELDRTGDSASAADFVYYGSSCAAKLPDHPERASFLEAATVRLTGLVIDQDAPLSIDDRSDAMRILREVLIARGDQAAARRWARRQQALLDEAAVAAPTPLIAMTYNWPRAEVYVYLGEAAALVDSLKRSVKALPRQYDPPYRLAWVHHQLGQHAEALVMAERAAALAYGPRKARVQELVAAIHAARGDAAARRAALEKAIQLYEQLPEGQKQPAALARLRKTLAAL